MATLESSSKEANGEAAILPTLREGSQGPGVRVLQAVLHNKGFDAGQVDGIFGPKPKQAVMAFQRTEGLAEDGVVGPETWERLQDESSASRTAAAFVCRALSQNGDRYVYGAEVDLNDPNPSAFDCSELVQWAAHQVGVYMPDGSANQLSYIQRSGKTIPVCQAMNTRGALFFKPGHVAISLGDGRTIEAKGSRYGVGIFSAQGRAWTTGGLIPGMKY